MVVNYIVNGVITDTDSTNPNNAKVVIRNNTTGDELNAYTNTSGQYAKDIANFENGYLATDNITVSCAYGTADADDSFLISDYPGAGHQVDLTLTAAADSADVNYCTIQDVWDELGDKDSSDISYARVRKSILRAESEIEEHTGSAWKSVTVTEEIYDWNEHTGYKSPEQLRYVNVIDRHDYWHPIYNDTLKLKHRPIVSVTSLYKNSASQSGTDDWDELTEQEGSEGDFLIYANEGLIKFIDDLPRYGKRSIKITYIYGHSTVPRAVERLTILLAVRDIIRSKASESQFDSQESKSIDGLTIQGAGSSGATSYLRFLNEEIDRSWNKIGSFSSTVA